MEYRLLVRRVGKIGAGIRDRTEDLLITSQMLYQLSYAGVWWELERETRIELATNSLEAYTAREACI